jgi:hypothetical protein
MYSGAGRTITQDSPRDVLELDSWQEYLQYAPNYISSSGQYVAGRRSLIKKSSLLLSLFVNRFFPIGDTSKDAG